jgi:hypothetical protein
MTIVHWLYAQRHPGSRSRGALFYEMSSRNPHDQGLEVLHMLIKVKGEAVGLKYLKYVASFSDKGF